jgi:superfamily I DNA/RNA helicase
VIIHVEPQSRISGHRLHKQGRQRDEGSGPAKLVYDQFLGYTPSLHISTFHSFCARFLRASNANASIIRKASPSMTKTTKATASLRSVAEPFGYRKGDDMVKEAALNYINEQKLHGRYPEDITISQVIPLTTTKTYYQFYQQYELKKTVSFALDFDDLLLKTIEILERNADVRTKWERTVSTIFSSMSSKTPTMSNISS